ncbi:trp RNA-binding attenuation protein MtrB [Paenibacillus sp. LHD-117]|uniref:trp RNA-binding attenuation protein MtrB n=1 Tax=Paenibacillus sp. LHD-117 TaxID=3071412 RepID=UPI0027DEC579|nr:trp RNA-binding attenuation protein MtrB [Paenibacillus sp. LHD-117]MDQ6418239.1 trp RNA-binding attenuation protein MtrB [Paenibacillus sp. LHD-117]
MTKAEEITMEQPTVGEYIVIKAKDQGVQVIGLTRGQDTKFHHTEKLDRNEVLICQFTDHTSAIKIRGRATVLTKYGTVETDQ